MDTQKLTVQNKNPPPQAKTSALQQSENRFRAAFQESPDAVALIRVNDHRLIDINKGFTSLTGYQKKEVMGKSISEINFWHDAAEQEEFLSALSRGGTMLNTEAMFRNKQGDIKIGLISSMVITQDATPHFLLVIRDIDVLKKTEEALEVSEARFRELYNNMSSGVAIYSISDDNQTLLLDCNRAAERIERITSKKRYVGKDVQDIFPDFREGDLATVLLRVYKTGKAEHFPLSRWDEDTLLSWKEYYVYKLVSGEIITVFDDITERKIAEEKLLQYQEELRTVTSELSLAEEHERRCLATELHDQIGQTLSVLHMKLHDLREKITASDSVKDIDTIQGYLKQVIQDTRSLTFELSPPVLYELGLEAALEWLGEEFRKKYDLVCTLDTDNTPKPLEEDVRMVLFRAVRELLMNIVKHAKSNKAAISIFRREETLHIEVEDQGVGFNLRKSDSRITKKYGFGLFSIRERLSHLGGNLDIHSKPGRGTRVTLVAPLKMS
jgi:PAS domain S-box-containing protein